MKEEGRGGGSELGSDLDLDPDPLKNFWIRIRQNDTDPQHWFARQEIRNILVTVTCLQGLPGRKTLGREHGLQILGSHSLILKI